MIILPNKIHTSSFRGITYLRTKLMLNTIVLLPSSAKGQKKNTRIRCIMQSVVGAHLSSEALASTEKWIVIFSNIVWIFRNPQIPKYTYTTSRGVGGGGGRKVTYNICLPSTYPPHERRQQGVGGEYQKNCCIFISGSLLRNKNFWIVFSKSFENQSGGGGPHSIIWPKTTGRFFSKLYALFDPNISILIVEGASWTVSGRVISPNSLLSRD